MLRLGLEMFDHVVEARPLASLVPFADCDTPYLVLKQLSVLLEVVVDSLECPHALLRVLYEDRYQDLTF